MRVCACVCVCVSRDFSMLVLASAKASYHRTDKTDQLNWLCVSYLCICVCTYIYNIYVRIQRIEGYVCTVYVRGGTCAYVSGCTKGRIEKRKNSAQRREGKEKRKEKKKSHTWAVSLVSTEGSERRGREWSRDGRNLDFHRSEEIDRGRCLRDFPRFLSNFFAN